MKPLGICVLVLIERGPERVGASDTCIEPTGNSRWTLGALFISLVYVVLSKSLCVSEYITNLSIFLLFFIDFHVALDSLRFQIFLLSPSNLKNNTATNKQNHKSRQARLKSSFRKKILTF